MQTLEDLLERYKGRDCGFTFRRKQERSKIFECIFFEW